MEGLPIFELLVILVLILLNGIFSGTEMALVTAKPGPRWDTA